jgi:NAD(P)-dependent dehydrogenase (short-subunit alcohol dehydrogenase family)
MNRLAGKTAIVTGAASGIGRAAAELFATEGAQVVAVDLAPGVEAVAHGIAERGSQALALVGDTAEASFVGEVVEAALRGFGALDIAFANAGISGGLVPFFDLTLDDWNSVLRVNLVGTFLMAQAAARVMVKQQRGSIICTASVAGLRFGAGGMPYSASKAGVISLVQTAANQLSGTGVRVNAICPGLTETGMTQPIFASARARGTEHKLGQLNPLKRGAVPSEIAHVALFLASDDSSYVNGQAIAADGGLSSSHPVVPGKMS